METGVGGLVDEAEGREYADDGAYNIHKALV
jgi:hypothetical protein